MKTFIVLCATFSVQYLTKQTHHRIVRLDAVTARVVDDSSSSPSFCCSHRRRQHRRVVVVVVVVIVVVAVAAVAAVTIREFYLRI